MDYLDVNIRADKFIQSIVEALNTYVVAPKKKFRKFQKYRKGKNGIQTT